ncbi:MAG: signal recognition particle protein [Nitrospinae bacterium]|nr:signal recognition particle protein [Nitrospinota bacterium]
MFAGLSARLEDVFRRLRSRGKLTEVDIREGLREVRLALLEADVNYGVVKDFVEQVREKALGETVLQSLTPGQQVLKIVHQELVSLMGGSQSKLVMAPHPPTVVMLVGLQGSGKTTTAAKLAKWLQKEGHRPFLIPADIYRPAAIEQLKILGQQISIPVWDSNAGAKPLDICREAIAAARSRGDDIALIDTAGRLHIDEAMMEELKVISREIAPQETLLVADSMTGQDAVNVAKTFNEALALDGIILTKLDGDARGGAALSIRAVTGKPVKFVGVGEKVEAFEPFHPERIASRILGMGDILSLIEKAEEAISVQQAKELEKKLREESFTLEDFKEQLQQVRKIGPLDQILSLLPGMGGIKNLHVEEKEFVRIEAIINSMTPTERQNPSIIDGSRRRRIARGSGTQIQDVNRLLKQFVETRKLMKRFVQGGKKAKIGGGRWPLK